MLCHVNFARVYFTRKNDRTRPHPDIRSSSAASPASNKLKSTVRSDVRPDAAPHPPLHHPPVSPSPAEKPSAPPHPPPRGPARTRPPPLPPPSTKPKNETEQTPNPRSLVSSLPRFKVCCAAQHNAKREAKRREKSHSPAQKFPPPLLLQTLVFSGSRRRAPGPLPLSPLPVCCGAAAALLARPSGGERSARAWIGFVSFLRVSNPEARLDGLAYPKSCLGSRISLYPLVHLAVDSCAAPWFGWRVRFSSYLVREIDIG